MNEGLTRKQRNAAYAAKPGAWRRWLFRGGTRTVKNAARAERRTEGVTFRQQKHRARPAKEVDLSPCAKRLINDRMSRCMRNNLHKGVAAIAGVLRRTASEPWMELR
jgi:DNA-directed RNA polymerase specialized sigma24 family protein